MIPLRSLRLGGERRPAAGAGRGSQRLSDEVALLVLPGRLASPARESSPAGEKCIGNRSNPERRKK